MFAIREATDSDRDAIWDIFREVIASGDTFVFDPNMPREAAFAFWFQPGARQYVAVEGGRVLGGYMLRPNQPGLGSHVGNGAYMVGSAGRGRGAGRALGAHSIGEARRLGFRAIQFNYVVSTNAIAVRLWQQLGFKIVGTLPGAFRHARLGFVDVYVMFRELERE
jgi:L-amino acid N-acyltransferase YncA